MGESAHFAFFCIFRIQYGRNDTFLKHGFDIPLYNSVVCFNPQKGRAQTKVICENGTFENARKFPNLHFSSISKSNMADMKKSWNLKYRFLNSIQGGLSPHWSSGHETYPLLRYCWSEMTNFYHILYFFGKNWFKMDYIFCQLPMTVIKTDRNGTFQ